MKRESLTTHPASDIIVIYKTDGTHDLAKFHLVSPDAYFKSIPDFESFTVNGSEKFKTWDAYQKWLNKPLPENPNSNPLF